MSYWKHNGVWVKKSGVWCKNANCPCAVTHTCCGCPSLPDQATVVIPGSWTTGGNQCGSGGGTACEAVYGPYVLNYAWCRDGGQSLEDCNSWDQYYKYSTTLGQWCFFKITAGIPLGVYGTTPWHIAIGLCFGAASYPFNVKNVVWTSDDLTGPVCDALLGKTITCTKASESGTLCNGSQGSTATVTF